MKAVIFYRRLIVDEVDFFYREVDLPDRPAEVVRLSSPRSA